MIVEQKKIDDALLIKEKELLHEQISFLQEKLFSTRHFINENRLLFEQLSLVQEELFKQNQLILEHQIMLNCISMFEDISIFRNILPDPMVDELNKIILNNPINPQEFLSGAPGKVKEGITYRLGAKIIFEARTLKGFLRLPFTLSKMKKEYYNNQNNLFLEKNMPSIELYRDASEALKCKEHLSYRLGKVYEAHSNSIIGWIKMPFSLLLELRDFRRSK